MSNLVTSDNKKRSALFLYSRHTGLARVRRKLPKIIEHLKNVFASLEVVETTSMEHGQRLAVEACGKYDVLIVFGGDGTIRNIIDVLAEKENTPILGYINGGTTCDFGHNFGVKGKQKRALRIIEEGRIAEFDVGKINDEHFGYVAAVGAFADIPYVTKRKYKKRIGSLAYYFKAVKEALIPDAVEGVLHVDGKDIPFKTPFLLCLSGRRVGGFQVSSGSKTDDGELELYITRPGAFNGLLHYLFFKVRTDCYRSSHFKIDINYPNPWDLDGEKGPVGSVEITCLKRKLRIFCAKQYSNI